MVIVSMAARAEPRGESFLFCLCKFWVAKSFQKSAGKIFLSGLRGAKNVSVVFFVGSFFGSCRVFRVKLNIWGGGAISFCRRAALRYCSDSIAILCDMGHCYESKLFQEQALQHLPCKPYLTSSETIEIGQC